MSQTYSVAPLGI